ncbi:MAG: hypothetical protein ACLF0G_10815 [Candidatus Brocadiia bacterium]
MRASERDRKLALKCLDCGVCNIARRKQKGIIFWLVKKIEGSLCPACKAYERVLGRQAHLPLSDEEKAELRGKLEGPPDPEPQADDREGC